MNIKKNERFRLEELFYSGWLRVAEEPEHWINGWDEGFSFCYDCAVKKVDELLEAEPDEEYSVDGGWGTDGDSTRFCETCYQLLSNTLTSTGCEDEVRHFLSYKFDPLSAGDCRSMYEVIQSSGWESWVKNPSECERCYFKAFHKLCRIILNDNPLIMPDNDYRHMWS